MLKDKDPHLTIMPFGKHKGEYLGDIPLDYLIWVYENLDLHSYLSRDIKKTIEILERSQSK